LENVRQQTLGSDLPPSQRAEGLEILILNPYTKSEALNPKHRLSFAALLGLVVKEVFVTFGKQRTDVFVTIGKQRTSEKDKNIYNRAVHWSNSGALPPHYTTSPIPPNFHVTV
jgi:hypothetical protein